MQYNGAICDIYIGKRAGKKLLIDLKNAKSSIKIVSPYLSPFLISGLIELKKRNIEIELITTDNIEDFHDRSGKNIHKLILQNRETDYPALEKREKWKDTVKILTYITVGYFAALVGMAYYLLDIKISLGLIPLIILFLTIRLFRDKIKKKRIYTYWYSQLFPFKVFMSPDKTQESDMFIHSKIYIIDEQIAYLGSLNFTASGTKHNYETSIRTIDKTLLRELIDEFDQLINHSNLPERNIQLWGQQLYSEPIN